MTAVAVFASLLVFIWLKLPRLRAQSKSISIEIDLELESKHAPFMASRRRLEEFVRADEHKGWRSLVEVDGLKNSEVVMFVTSTTNGNNHFLWDR
ncbi:hypothetical protein EON65_19085 [archaeon]|nr:MAG: hypothetical protein EON65_19085 [archaeon]